MPIYFNQQHLKPIHSEEYVEYTSTFKKDHNM